MKETTVVRHGTSGVAILLGVLASIGTAALLTPLVAGTLGSGDFNLDAAGSAIPVLVALVVSTFIGGHVAGRIAGDHTSWHGLMTGIVGLGATCAYLLIGVAAQRGALGFPVYTAMPELFPGVLTVSLYQSTMALAFGLLFGLPAQIVAAWFGGLLAPTRTARIVREPEPRKTYTRDSGPMTPRPLI